MEQAQELVRKRALTIINMLIVVALVVLIVVGELLQGADAGDAAATSATAAGPLIAFGSGGAFSYTPATLTVRAGEPVEWRGRLAEHPLLSVDGLWPRQASGDTFSHTFDAPGTYRYYCQFHGGPTGGMAGTVVVE